MTDLTVSVHQPNFMPWLKLLDKILASDVYVAYDTAQFTKTEYHARQRVMTPSKPVWMTVPVLSTGDYQPIQDVQIDNKQPFRRQHLHRLRKAYDSTPHFDEVYGLVDQVYAGGHEQLVDLSLDLIEALRAYLDAPVRIVRASTLPHEGGAFGHPHESVPAPCLRLIGACVAHPQVDAVSRAAGLIPVVG